jgi:hypothetical protein
MIELIEDCEVDLDSVDSTVLDYDMLHGDCDWIMDRAWESFDDFNPYINDQSLEEVAAEHLVDQIRVEVQELLDDVEYIERLVFQLDNLV